MIRFKVDLAYFFTVFIHSKKDCKSIFKYHQNFPKFNLTKKFEIPMIMSFTLTFNMCFTHGVGSKQKSAKATAAVVYTEANNHKNIMEKRPQTLKRIRTHRECMMAPTKSKRQKRVKIPEKRNKTCFLK